MVSFKYEAEAVAIANDTQFGLALGVFTRDLTRAHHMIRAIQAGIVWVNTYRTVGPIAPFGGHGLSWHGREGGIEAAPDFTRSKPSDYVPATIQSPISLLCGENQRPAIHTPRFLPK